MGHNPRRQPKTMTQFLIYASKPNERIHTEQKTAQGTGHLRKPMKSVFLITEQTRGIQKTCVFRRD
jgi:hypothetical protein